MVGPEIKAFLQESIENQIDEHENRAKKLEESVASGRLGVDTAKCFRDEAVYLRKLIELNKEQLKIVGKL